MIAVTLNALSNNYPDRERSLRHLRLGKRRIILDALRSRIIRDRSVRFFHLFPYSILVLFEVSSDRLTVICTY